MFDLLTANENQVFTVALVVMFVIAILEGVGFLLGAGLSEALEALLPEVDFDADVDIDGHATTPGAFSRLLGWLRVGEVPILMLLVLFLTAFGLLGLTIQSVAIGSFGSYLPGWVATVPTLLIALPTLRVLAGLLAFVLPKDETDAVAEAEFIGRVATITLGEARQGHPAEAKLTDQHGQTHYIMVEPDSPNEEFDPSTPILITEKVGSTFKGIKTTRESLVD